MKESEIQKSILEWLKLEGYLAWRNYVGPILRGKGIASPNPMAGMPDICGLFADGTFFAIEVKKPGGKVSPKQTMWIKRLNEAGAIAFVARSLETVIRRFEEL